MKITFEKLYRYDRIGEPCCIAVPVKEGLLRTAEGVRVLDGGRELPSQTKVTSRHRDGSVRFLFTRFLADLPGNAGKAIDYELEGGPGGPAGFTGIRTERRPDGWLADTGAVRFLLKDGGSCLFERVETGNRVYGAEQFAGPFLGTDQGSYGAEFGTWEQREEGPVCVRFRTRGRYIWEGNPESCPGSLPSFECGVTAFAGKPWLDLSFRLINTTDGERHIRYWQFGVKRTPESCLRSGFAERADKAGTDSTGCGDCKESGAEGDLFRTWGVKELPAIEAAIPLEQVRTCVGRSNYKTAFTIGKNGSRVCETADAELLAGEANEHFGEVFYGTFFGDVTDEAGGVCATVFQAQQNFPKAVTAERDGLWVMLVPEGIDRVAMASGMSREQRIQLHFHGPEETLAELDNRSLIYQMPDRPQLSPEEYRRSGVFPDVFLDRERQDRDVEIALTARADGHARCYGMMNWGDAPDMNYTDQGRGGGRLVWTNNEYDYPHAMYLMYVRTGVRRFLDYANVAASHWMDVDVCHFSGDPLRLGGQWEHTFGHCGGGVMVCSHEWVEGLLDCYHFTGNERALETALGIGENVLRLLETPMYQKSGESSARETGWALRTLTALYTETWDEKWMTKCQWILNHFREWTEEYGQWVAPYTDNTLIRVGFMISVAVGSLMRYYRVAGGERLREMILAAVDDLAENCLLDNGLFYYKELPSLARNGNNTLLLEAMAIGYELTGDRKYLECGRKTFQTAIQASAGGAGGAKRIVEDTVIAGSGGTKGFAQSFLPLAVFYKALAEEGML